MKFTNTIAAAAVIAAAAFGATSANAGIVFQFDGSDGSGGGFDTPVNVGNINPCLSFGTAGRRDLCTLNDADGFDYSKFGVNFTATAEQDGAPAELVQDLIGNNQGLGVISHNENRVTQDQINPTNNESIVFTFDDVTTIFDIRLNDGLGRDCPGGGNEGACGTVAVSIDGGAQITWDDFILDGVLATSGGVAVSLTGTVFEFFALGDGSRAGGGYSIEEFSVVPVPGALPLLLSGIAGLGFASRRRNKTA